MCICGTGQPYVYGVQKCSGSCSGEDAPDKSPASTANCSKSAFAKRGFEHISSASAVCSVSCVLV